MEDSGNVARAVMAQDNSIHLKPHDAPICFLFCSIYELWCHDTGLINCTAVVLMCSCIGSRCDDEHYGAHPVAVCDGTGIWERGGRG
jgi:hypothetical protein